MTEAELTEALRQRTFQSLAQAQNPIRPTETTPGYIPDELRKSVGKTLTAFQLRAQVPAPQPPALQFPLPPDYVPSHLVGPEVLWRVPPCVVS